MDLATLSLLVLAAALLGATVQAWRIGNDRRDVRLLGGITGFTSLGAVATALW
ncbi:hypothetical protein KAK07_19470 [Ideonella sp. 4Y16]|uniref:Uncharacterized protein n=1 Tax=Ideonella alba TaxID=2824118 RepID=A0A941BDZ2_9BURK|nr:hypothetical protein [Ideonella alba]MBQ0929417.1 hypothetical protein [Ideonella alba]MBQ0945528.1 hypothetical protein [Ideonella alba]